MNKIESKEMSAKDFLTTEKDSVDADVIDYVIVAVQRWIDNRSEKDKRAV